MRYQFHNRKGNQINSKHITWKDLSFPPINLYNVPVLNDIKEMSHLPLNRKNTKENSNRLARKNKLDNIKLARKILSER